MIHRHRWIVKTSEDQPSQSELADWGPGSKARWIPATFFTRPRIVTYTCTKCGAEKVKRL